MVGFLPVVVASCIAFLTTPTLAFVPNTSPIARVRVVRQAVEQETKAELTHRTISDLRFRQLQDELRERGAATDGTTAQLRSRLRQLAFPEDECTLTPSGAEECSPEVSRLIGYATQTYLS